MGEIEIKLVWRHVGAFGHETHVTKRARINDRFEFFAIDRIEFTCICLVDQVEKARKTVAKIKTAPATVAYVKNTAQLFVQFLLVKEIRVIPINRMTSRRFEATFAHGVTLELW